MVRNRIKGGALLIAGAAVSLVFDAQVLLNAIENLGGFFGDRAVTVLYIGTFLTVMNAVAVVGGALALAGRAWAVVMVGAVLGILGGLYPMVGTVLGIIAVVFLALSRDEFPGERRLPAPAPYPPGYAPPGYAPPGYQPQPYAQPPSCTPQPQWQPQGPQPPPQQQRQPPAQR